MSSRRVTKGSRSQRLAKGSRDLISSLPDEILGKILSSLPTKLAASTSVLSKRWKNLIALVDNLDFDEEDKDSLSSAFCKFVEKTLALLSNSSTIKSFSLNYYEAWPFCPYKSRVDSWIRTVLESGVLEIYLETRNSHCIETEFFTSSKLVKLTLAGGFYPKGLLPRGGVFFPKLKKLSLLSAVYEHVEMYEHLISGCPLLEELVLRYGDYNTEKCPPSEWDGEVYPSIEVSSQSVKRLSISYDLPGYRESPVRECIRTPSLLYLDYCSYVAEQYDVDFGSLVEARLDLQTWLVQESDRDEDAIYDISYYDSDEDEIYDYSDEDDFTEDENDDGYGKGEDENANEESDGDAEDVVLIGDVTDLIAGISNVKTLHLSSHSLEVFHFCCKSMPVFQNLLTLSFDSDKERGWQGLPRVLNNSPNLETLIIQGLVHQVTDQCGDVCVCSPNNKKIEKKVSCLSTCQVKLLHISGYKGTYKEVKQMRHFLRNLKCLETLKVGVIAEIRREDDNVDQKYLRITNALTKLSRVSTKCQIHFFRCNHWKPYRLAV